MVGDAAKERSPFETDENVVPMVTCIARDIKALKSIVWLLTFMLTLYVMISLSYSCHVHILIITLHLMLFSCPFTLCDTWTPL